MENRLLAYSPASWREFFEDKTTRHHIREIEEQLAKEKDEIVPCLEKRFTAFFTCPLDKLSVVILGMDPYPNRENACGMSFATKKKGEPPASLKNIYKRMEETIPHFKSPGHSDLTHWASQGVLLLNTALTTVHGKSGAHMSIWSPFTKHLLHYICTKREKIVFMLWGNDSKKKSSLISKKHSILTCHHPSPLSVNRSKKENNPDHFMNNDHHNEVNRILAARGEPKINWIFPGTYCSDKDVMVFDIETTGFRVATDHITTIVWFYDQEVKYWKYGMSPDDFIVDWYKSKEVVGYNSISFDERFVAKKFEIEPHKNHTDLKKIYAPTGVTGGLKNLCKFFKVARADSEGNFEGSEASYVGKDVIRGKTGRLNELLYYNFLDTEETYKLYCLHHNVVPNKYKWTLPKK